MSNRATMHIEDNDLLMLLDGELPERRSSHAREHLAACWTCRTRLDEFKSTIGAFVRHRENVNPLLPPPPAAWADLQPKFDAVDRSIAPPRRRPLGLRPAHWLAIAASVLIAMVAVYRLQRVPSVKAAELLRKAVAAERSAGPHRRIQIRTARRTFSRPAALAVYDSSESTGVKVMFERASFSWEEPLSARSFAAWRDQLPEKTDNVRALDNDEASGVPVYVIQTSTAANELRRATLTLRALDLEPMREILDFSGGTVEITALPEAAPELAETPAAPATVERTPHVESTYAAGVHEQLEVFAALHRLAADLGEPVEVRPSGSRILVVGTGLPPSRREQLRASLSGIAGVDVRFDEAVAAVHPGVPAGRTNAVTAPAPARLQALLGGRESAEDFTNRALDASDAVMGRVHALRTLAKAFPPDTEAALPQPGRDVLASLCRDHATALSARLRDLRSTLQPILPAEAPSAVPDRAAAWQDAVQALFAAAEAFDESLNAALAGAGPDQDSAFDRLPTALATLDARAAQFLNAVP